MDMKRPVSTLIKKAIKVEKENKTFLRKLRGQKQISIIQQNWRINSFGMFENTKEAEKK